MELMDRHVLNWPPKKSTIADILSRGTERERRETIRTCIDDVDELQDRSGILEEYLVSSRTI